MIRVLLFLLLNLFLILGCNSKTNHPRILSKEEMGKVTWDIMLTEDYLNNTFRDSLKEVNKERLVLYLKVFQLHKISKEDYNYSLKYYSSKPDQMKDIFDTLSVRGRRVGPH
jgi:hypothetical protein